MYTKLFEPYQMASLPLKNRFVMAPLTRSRSSQPGDVPNELMATYYAQRSGAGLIIAEATQISLQGQGYAHTPGIYTAQQIEGWKLITHAVHQNEGKIFLQLWHVGRVSSAKVNGLQPLAPSAIKAPNSQVYIFDGAPNGDVTRIPTDVPKAMTIQDIEDTVKDYVKAAQNAMEAGFDGVEIHAAHGYLIDTFLKKESNHRQDQYGGSHENNIRFLEEVTTAVVKAIGKDKTGVRLSPFIEASDTEDVDIIETFFKATHALNNLGIAYLHLSEGDGKHVQSIDTSFRIRLRNSFQHTLILTGNKTPEKGEMLLQANLGDLIGFGRKFIANPDYPERVRIQAPLNEISNTHTIYGGGSSKGYTDYPLWKTNN